jgi:hypothetical protein
VETEPEIGDSCPWNLNHFFSHFFRPTQIERKLQQASITVSTMDLPQQLGMVSLGSGSSDSGDEQQGTDVAR